ncbi:MAG: cytochrome c [Sphingosinicella sp.]|uniref:cytochrome c n=1 Tax=Sphingosinicella sp. TaxID=1917971 RepID=UPI004037763E
MKRGLLLGATLIAIPLTAALAQTPPAGLTPEQIVAARQSSFMLSGGAFAGMKFAADAGADVKQLAFPARSLARWARTLPSMFPAGTNLPNSKARPEIWSDRPGFEARAQAYAAAATALAEAAQAGDRAVFLERWAAARAACSGCHDNYRSD